MDIDRVTLIDPDDGVRRSLSDVVVRSLRPSAGSLVLEAPVERVDGTPFGERPGGEAGWSLVVTTADGRTYTGYVEVVATGDDARFYWCGIGF